MDRDWIDVLLEHLSGMAIALTIIFILEAVNAYV